MTRETAWILIIIGYIAGSFFLSAFSIRRRSRRRVPRQREIPNANDIHHLAARARGKRSWQSRASA